MPAALAAAGGDVLRWQASQADAGCAAWAVWVQTAREGRTAEADAVAARIATWQVGPTWRSGSSACSNAWVHADAEARGA